ncbi:MAG: right-handed parallel beta-helix repeat-containing protein [Thaumarchaeota archaeon]|nr:MAG: right-handed parallel beta-helix repeat-containing protein [Nitrososphaerota archaeon]
MSPTLLFVILAIVAFVVLIWNLLLPIQGQQNKQFIGFLLDVFRHGYENSTVVQRYIDKPIVTPIKEEIDAMINKTDQGLQTYSIGPQILDSSKESSVTLTFYVEYGNNRYLPDLLDLLYKYKIDKAVFFLDKKYSHENPFMVKRIQYNGYIVHGWQTIGKYDKDYPPTTFDGTILADKEILARAKNDRDASSFLQTAISYHDSIVAFTPKIMLHKFLLETLLNHNGKDITFTESNNTSTENSVIGSDLSVYTFNKNVDPVLQYLQVGDIKETEIRAGEWTMHSLADKFPNTVQFLSDKNAFLIMRPILVDKNASLNLINQNIMFLSNQKEIDFPSTFLEVKGTAKTGNTNISSYDPILNKPDPNGYHPRPFVLVRDGAVMNLSNSTITHLGYSPGGFENTKVSKPAITYYNTTNVDIENSILKYNYYGFYSTNTNNIRIVNSQVFGNTKNGFDAHGTTNLYVSRNHIYNNGDQGFICSVHCLNVTIINNTIEHNGAGIGLHWLNTHSVIKDNIVRYNAKFGIFIEKNSSHNLVINNTIIGNQYGIGLIQNSNGNNLTQNILVDNISGQIIVEPDSQSNIENDNKVYSSKDPSSIPQRVKSQMTEIFAGEQK